MSFIINPYVFGGGGGGFVPTDEPTLDWWLTADSLSLSDNDPVIDWLDSSSAGKHYGNSIGTEPVYKTNILNGRPVVRFAGGDKLGPDPNARTYGPASTMILVCTPSSTTNSYIFGGSGGAGVPAFISGFSSKAFEYFNSTERATFAATTSGFHILTLIRTDDTGNAVGYFDGAAAFSIAVNASLDWNGLQVSEIGTNGAAGGEDPYNGDIAQIIHCSSVLDATGLNNMHGYLSDEYGISVTLI